MEDYPKMMKINELGLDCKIAMDNGIRAKA